jgi:hypothetical protein
MENYQADGEAVLIWVNKMRDFVKDIGRAQNLVVENSQLSMAFL